MVRRVLLVAACLLALYAVVDAANTGREVVEQGHTEVSVLGSNVAAVSAKKPAKKPAKKSKKSIGAALQKTKRQMRAVKRLIRGAKSALLRSTNNKILRAKKALARLNKAQRRSRKRKFKRKRRRNKKFWQVFKSPTLFKEVCAEWTKTNARSARRRCTRRIRVYRPKPLWVKRPVRVHCLKKFWIRKKNQWKCTQTTTYVIPFSSKRIRGIERMIEQRFKNKIQRKITEAIANAPHITKAALASRYAAAKMKLAAMARLLAQARARCKKKIAACRAKLRLSSPKAARRHRRILSKKKKLVKKLENLKKTLKEQAASL